MHSYPFRSRQNPVSSLPAIVCYCHLAPCHLFATGGRVKVIREVIHAEIRSAVEVIQQEDQDWKVGVGVMGTYWALLGLCGVA